MTVATPPAKGDSEATGTSMLARMELSQTAEQDIPTPASVGCEAPLCSREAEETSAEPLLPEAQRRWAAQPLSARLAVVRIARHRIAARPEVFAHAIAPELLRAQADTLTAELLPLLDAMRFLERMALGLLAPQRLSARHRPVWLTGVAAEVQRVPLGHVLVIGPANFPLFLPGVQVLQALVAGNAVTWKPGTGGAPVARLLANILRDAGLPRGVLHVTGEAVSHARRALAAHPDKVVFTGSAQTGRLLLRELADTLTPATMELSGADAVVVLPSADLALVAKAAAFGLRLNGAEVCMSPRRLVGTHDTLKALRPLLISALQSIAPVLLKPKTAASVAPLLEDAVREGAVIIPLSPNQVTPLGTIDLTQPTAPILLDQVTPAMQVTRSDIFAPVLSLLGAPSVLHIPEVVNQNPYALTAAVFGEAEAATTLAEELRVGTVVINDLIAPTADPRVPFGGRGHSGFGVTRGAEGLLEMTAVRTVLRRRKAVSRHYDPLGPRDLPLFAGLIGFLHGGSLTMRWKALRQLFQSARRRHG